MSSANEKVVHLFHWPCSPEYQENLLQIIALPTGARGARERLYYEKKWVNETFIKEIENINDSGAFDSIFWVLSCEQTKETNKVVTTFSFACPVRLLKILSVEMIDNYYYIDFIAQEIISEFRKIDNLDTLRNFMGIEFDGAKIPYPGVERGYVYTGPKKRIETTQTLSLEALYRVLKDIPCLLEYQGGITIKDYPLVRIKTIENSKVNEGGLFELSIDKEYNISLFCCQGDSHRDRPLYINGSRLIGKSAVGKIPIKEIRKGKDKINIEVKCENLIFQILLSVVVKIPWYKWRFTPLIFLALTSLLSFYLFPMLVPKSSIEIQAAMVPPLIVLFLLKLYEILSKIK